MTLNSITISFLASFLCLVSLQASWGASIVFVDNSKGSYMKHSQDNVESQSSFSPLTVSAAMASLLGVSPNTKIDSSMSYKLNGLLSHNLFSRPYGVLSLSVAGLDSDSINNGSPLTEAGFPFYHEHSLSYSEDSLDSSSDTSVIAKTLSQSFISLSSNLGDHLEVLPLECSARCSSSCINQELEALAAVIGATFVPPNESSRGSLTVNLGKSEIVFDLSSVADRIFTSELACLFHNIKNRGSKHFDGMHNTPELLVGTLTGLQVMKNQYGISAKTKAAESISIRTITHCMDLLNEVYHGRIATSLIFLGNTDLSKLGYLKGMANKHRSSRVLEDSTDDSAALITLFVAIFAGVLLIIAALLAIYALFSMPITRDSLLYSSVKLD